MPDEWFSAIERRDLEYVKNNVVQCQGLRDPGGATALMLAAQRGDDALISILLPYEANMEDADGLPASIYAARASQIEVLDKILEVESGFKLPDSSDVFMYLIDHHQNDILPLVVHHFSVCEDYNGYTHLDHAVLAGNLFAVKCLLEHFEHSDTSLYNALRHAVRAKNVEIVSFICEFGGYDVNSIVTSPQPKSVGSGTSEGVTEPVDRSYASQRYSAALSDALELIIESHESEDSENPALEIMRQKLMQYTPRARSMRLSVRYPAQTPPPRPKQIADPDLQPFQIAHTASVATMQACPYMTDIGVQVCGPTSELSGTNLRLSMRSHSVQLTPPSSVIGDPDEALYKELTELQDELKIKNALLALPPVLDSISRETVGQVLQALNDQMAVNSTLKHIIDMKTKQIKTLQETLSARSLEIECLQNLLDKRDDKPTINEDPSLTDGQVNIAAYTRLSNKNLRLQLEVERLQSELREVRRPKTYSREKKLLLELARLRKLSVGKENPCPQGLE
ncbi:Ankyrin repeat protein 1 [Giardia muris]|uniref:Ankyrin repeat protein 1 n=1 Tax=Giardia muris TaxID=5742 RepID=A0A4Z1SM31_GIAMU|nr:Ankyrin repeat protein 1 [Giardia muris]|eukprot:TNJ26734.1 Ankyrin repeat protein 1 [Giardia muris]